MRLYTGKGDQGMTDLLGDRVGKDDPRIDLIGALDESTSSIGLARALSQVEQGHDLAITAQRDLYQIMAELAFTDALRPDAYVLKPERVTWLSDVTDELSGRINLARHFILPGDTIGGGAYDVARTIVRRAERQAVALDRSGHAINPEIIRYLNRLSSLLFMLARQEDEAQGVTPMKAKEKPANPDRR